MQNKTFLFLLITLLTLVACAEPTTTPEATPAPTEAPTTEAILYQDASQPIEVRVADLLERMTLAEKVGQMTLIEKNSLPLEDVATYHIGAILSGGGGYPANNSPEGWLEMVNSYQEQALSTRLGIPMLYGVDAVHGHSNVRGTVIFPHNVGLGATRNAELVQEIGRITAYETAATGIYWNYAPVLAVPRDIRWGRTYEGYGEDTQLVTDLSQAFLLGLQGDGLSAPTTVLGTPKHFVGDGGTSWGSSTTGDYQIDQGVTELDEETLRAVHLAPYQTAIDSGAMSIMISYSSWGGIKMHGQKYLITDVLREEMGFEGMIVSDWQGIDQITPDYYEAVVLSINAGIDLNMVPYDYKQFIDTLTQAVETGDVSEARIDEAVSRILTVKMMLGLFETPIAPDTFLAEVGSEEHRAVARTAVAQSLVLLQNQNGVLPIADSTQHIFVAGESADDIGIQSGGWTIEWQGKSGNITEGTTILEGIEARVGESTNVYFNRFGRFERQTDDNGDPIIADVAIVVIGEHPYAEGVGDSDALYLSEADIGILERTREQSEQVVVVLLTGRPLVITPQLPLADAWVVAWLPGSEGAGVADVLFGAQPFVGKLPFTWPRDMTQLPFDFTNLPTTGCDAPLFAYGYGLTAVETDPTPLLDCDI